MATADVLILIINIFEHRGMQMGSTLSHDQINKAIIRSQHCQRNWDLTQEIPAADMDLLLTAATQCPSKQNIAFYKVHFITNRDKIESIHALTKGFTFNYEPYEAVTNSQTLANLLVVFESNAYLPGLTNHRNDETKDLLEGKQLNAVQANSIRRDSEMSVGIAAGYLNLTASLLGYATGCCACFDGSGVRNVLQVDGDVLLLMGIGFRDRSRNRRLHHLDSSVIFPTKTKQAIPVTFVD